MKQIQDIPLRLWMQTTRLREGLLRSVVQASNALLFALGLALLSAGMVDIVHTNFTPPEAAQGKNPPTASGKAPEGARGSRPQGAIPLLPEPAFTDVTPERAFAAPPENQDTPYDDTLIRNSTGNLFAFIEGAFGALVMVVAGLGAIIAAAVGNYKLAYALIVVAVGAFILRALVSLFFGTNYETFNVPVQVGNI